jgi:hypothetical protein
MLGITGKDVRRVHELLQRGTLVSGASRLRWTGWDADRAAIESLLAACPGSDPGRPFDPLLCVRAILRGPACRIEISREAAAARRMIRRRSFWDLLLEFARSTELQYCEYSYKERADRYIAELTPAAADALKENAGMLKYSSLEAQVRSSGLDRVEFYVARAA